MSKSLMILATITPRPEQFSATRTALLELVPLTLAEPGCHRFELCEDIESSILFLYEEFANAQALEWHAAQPYTRAVFAGYKQWLRHPVEIRKIRRLA